MERTFGEIFLTPPVPLLFSTGDCDCDCTTVSLIVTFFVTEDVTSFVTLSVTEIFELFVGVIWDVVSGCWLVGWVADG